MNEIGGRPYRGSANGVEAVLLRMYQAAHPMDGTPEAEALGVPANTLKSWRRRGEVPPKALQSYAEAHEVSVDYLLHGEATVGETGDAPAPYRVTPAARVQRPAAPEIDAALLVLCHAACSLRYGSGFRLTPVEVQFETSADFYNSLLRMAAAQGAGLAQFRRLDAQSLAQQLRLFGEMGWVRKWQPVAPNGSTR